uniref:Uncharacterized protein MANES_01G097900 n=1 Tax=Rhizophora mucronata TaxID=61149 RepID=A0A2P2QGZ7_RHIMU
MIHRLRKTRFREILP